MTNPNAAHSGTTAAVDSPGDAVAYPHSMRVLPVERAVEWIRAWAELDWPITWETAYATRDKLDWKPNPQDPELFTTDLSANGQEDGHMTRLDGQCSGVSTLLSSRNLSAERNSPWATSLWRAYDAIADALTQLYGASKQTGDQSDVLQTDWILNNQVTVTLVASNKLMRAKVKSPAITAIDERERYYIEKHGENYVDD